MFHMEHQAIGYLQLAYGNSFDPSENENVLSDG